MNDKEIKKTVRAGYAAIARGENSCCQPADTSCCGGAVETLSQRLGYSERELSAVPEGADLGLGCGNPLAHADLQEGEVVIDLGSGAGFDCFLAARKVGARGKVIGVDMTAEMVDRARRLAAENKVTNVEFRLGEIENLPVADNCADLVISNCVINLAPDKERVFREAFRALKPGGRMIVSDIVLSRELPEIVKQSKAAYIGCVSGAALREKYLEMIENAGFELIEALEARPFPLELMLNDHSLKSAISCFGEASDLVKEFGSAIISIKIKAVKPG